MKHFEIIAKDGKARVGILKTAHGEVQTPTFMPVGTQASVKAMAPDDLKATKSQIILGNTYHLYLRPGSKLVKKMGGLHKFMNWEGPILTDSGGFQAFSLGAMIEHGVRKVPGKEKIKHRPKGELNVHAEESRFMPSKILEDGVEFTSHLDGSKHFLTPEISMEVQLDLGSDIVLVLDELLSPKHDKNYVEKSLARTHQWELRSKIYFKNHLKNGTNPKALLFGIVQGVYDKEIREREAKWVTEQGFDGISIGGSFGVSEFWGGDEVDWAAAKAIYETMEWVVPNLPEEMPKHILGIGEVQDFFECIERGIDMFDCVAPTRRARNGSLYISPKNGGNAKNKFVISLQRAEFVDDPKPIDPGCECFTCQNFSRSYLRHLYLSQEILFHRLATIHNVYFINNLVEQIRNAIVEKKFSSLKKKWLTS